MNTCLCLLPPGHQTLHYTDGTVLVVSLCLPRAWPAPRYCSSPESAGCQGRPDRRRGPRAACRTLAA